MALFALAQSACSVTDTTGSSGLVCPASISSAKAEAPQNIASFSVPVTAQGGDVSTFSNFTVTGNVVYERYYPRTSTPFGLDYTGATVAKGTLPVRRAIVQVMSGSTPIASGITDDSGNYAVPTVVAAGSSIFVRVLARSTATSNTPDGVAPDNCSGASWDIRVVNNVTNNAASSTDPSLRAQYSLDQITPFAAPSSGIYSNTQLTASLTWDGTSTYTARAGAPFALLDTAISGIETVCQGRANINYPVIYMNWSALNTNTSGNRYDGNISTSFFTTETSAKTANLYILGKVGVDTDELDNHVVAHEFGHFIENKIYRSDSIGGQHGTLDHLDTRLAFGEGFGNAFSGMVHADPVYTDTSGTAQASGFTINVSSAPTNAVTSPAAGADDNRGLWSEGSMQYMLYHLWQQNTNSFSRIHNILENYQKTSSAVTNGLTFASYYAEVYGASSEDLTNTWSGAGFLASPINALCTGSCSAGTPVWSRFDVDNDLGFAFTSSRHYKQNSGTTFTAPFWQIYRPLVSGTNAATTHDKISFGGYSVLASNLNKFGLHRLYTVVATGNTTTVSVSSISQGSEACNTNDLLDMAVYGKGVLLGSDETSSGATSNCPSVTFCSTAGQTYVIDVIGFGAVNAYNLSVSP